MSKWLIRNKESFESLKNDYNSDSNTPKTIWMGYGEPESYPCVIATFKENNDNGPDMINCEFIYIDDFEGLLVDPRAKMEDE